MPSDEMQAALADGTPVAVFAAASQFKVSITAAIFRLAELTRIQAVLDDGRRRTATMPELAAVDPHLDRTVEVCRQNGDFETVMRLSPNRHWNGDWQIKASMGGGGHLVLITAQPTDGRAHTEPSSFAEAANILEGIRETRSLLLSRRDPASGR
jgi:hypothetical protein